MDKKLKNLSVCVYCNMPFDKSSVKRQYGVSSAVYQLNFCSAKCYTEDVLKRETNG